MRSPKRKKIFWILLACLNCFLACNYGCFSKFRHDMDRTFGASSSPSITVVCLDVVTFPIQVVLFSCLYIGDGVRYVTGDSFVLRVRDEAGRPVPGAVVRGRAAGGFATRSIDKVTDVDGEALLRGYSSRDYVDWFSVKKEGFYDYGGGCGRGPRILPNRLTPGEDGRRVHDVRLKRIHHPVPMLYSRLEIPFEMSRSSCERLFDCERGDWLPPHGRGQVADIRMTSQHVSDAESASSPHSNVVEIAVLREHDGFAQSRLDDFSQLATDYVAPTGDVWNTKSISSLSLWDWNGEKGSRGSKPFPRDSYYAMRLRTELDATGGVVRAHYGKMLFREGARALVYFGAIPNERSIEAQTRKSEIRPIEGRDRLPYEP